MPPPLHAPHTIAVGYADEPTLLSALRSGDEDAFAWLVRRYHGPLLRYAAVFVSDRAVAEEVVQETWLGVIRGIRAFEGRSAVRTSTAGSGARSVSGPTFARRPLRRGAGPGRAPKPGRSVPDLLLLRRSFWGPPHA